MFLFPWLSEKSYEAKVLLSHVKLWDTKVPRPFVSHKDEGKRQQRSVLPFLLKLITYTSEDDTLLADTKFGEAAQGTADLDTDKRCLEVEGRTGIIILAS